MDRDRMQREATQTLRALYEWNTRTINAFHDIRVRETHVQLGQRGLDMAESDD